MNYVCLNGAHTRSGSALLQVDNKSFRYGDGLFETMKIKEGRILLASYHFDRLYKGFQLLGYTIPAHLDAAKLEKQVLELCRKNNCEKLARVRLSFYRGHGGLYDDSGTAGYTIESWELPAANEMLNENGLVIDLYSDAQKSCDALSGLKTANALVYSMAARYARDNRLNDCLVLNSRGHIADSTIANIFWIKEQVLYTNPAGEGAVEGVMRRWLLEARAGEIGQLGLTIKQAPCTVDLLMEAEEIFLTNAIRGIRWVKQFRETVFTNETSKKIHRLIAGQ